MTTKQLLALYFPAWNAAAKNHGWNTKAGRAPQTRVEFFGNHQVNGFYQRIWTIALERSGPAREVSAEHLRHACHLVALGHDKSSHHLTNQELDRVLALFQLLADPDDFRATMAWSNPQEEQRKRMLWWLRNKCVESYIVEISRQKFGTDDWESLPFESLRQLHMTLHNRAKAQRAPAAINLNREVQPF